MDHQSTGEGGPRISRSKARHLRRKRLVAARRTAESNLSLAQSDSEPNPSLRDPEDILSKSKARRLRKKKKAESIEGLGQIPKTETCVSESEEQTGSLISDQSPTNSLGDEKSDQNLCKLRSDTVDNFDRANYLTSLTEEEVSSSDLGGGFRTEQGESSLESDINSELFDSNKSLSENRIPLHDQNPVLELTDGAGIGNQLRKTNERIAKEKRDAEYLDEKNNGDNTGSGVQSFEQKSSNPSKTTSSCSPKTDLTSDDDLDSPSSNSRSHLIEQYEINTIPAHDSLGPITRSVKTVLNTIELIENEKNLKISGCSSSHAIFQPNAAVIDLTTYSSSDLIINTDSTSCNLDEQQIIVDFISDSSPGLVKNNKLFYTEASGLPKSESRNKNKSHRKSVAENLSNSENQAALDIIQNYSLPSTSVEASVTPEIVNFKESVACKTVEDPNKSEAKMSSVEKTREQIKAEREAKKAAKALAKGKGKVPKSEEKTDAAKSSKDTPTKASGTDHVRSEAKQANVVVKKGAAALENKTATTETETVPRADNKENESQSKVDEKSKRESRAERRAKQEAQRAAKEKLATEKSKAKSAAPQKLKAAPKELEPVKMGVKKLLADNNLHEVKLFKHLYHERELSLVNFPTLNSNIHPAIVRLGVQYASKVIIGSNARCVALLAAVKQLVEDFERPSQADFTRGLEASLQECAAYLHHCRPMAVSMQNALKHLKWQMTQLPTTVSDDDAKSKLGDAIDTYIKEQICLAGKAISNTIQTKISNGDVILTYAFSSLIHNILIDAHDAGKQFRVIVVDGRPWLEGKEQLRRLARHGIECSYILINALSFIMPEVSKVFLGAHAILANGAVMSRAGTAQVALMAKAFNVPVLVACETHKSCERVQTDSFVYNEIGDADELTRDLFSKSKKSLLVNWKTKKSLDLLNITYDVTPADLVSAVVTELAILPCTSIPVILRIKPSEI